MLLRQRAHAKINLALHIMGRRNDGYHELDSIVAFAGIADLLTAAPADRLAIKLSGPFAKDLPPGDENIVLKAWHLLAEFAAKRNAAYAPVEFHLEKNLPVAAGIGGGSADAAAALRGLVKCFNLSPTPQELGEIALRLGADVPVCLVQKTSRIGGIGEIIAPVETRLPPAIVLVNPGLSLPTSDVFASLGLDRGQRFADGIEDANDFAGWRNDLAPAATRILPEISEVIEHLKTQPGMACVRMSGSGATCFGLFESLDQAQVAANVISATHSNWWVTATTLI